ncbi:hypothetical protein J3R83DRAFT_11649 [Lanmaoa asiatica]|nr:hypothetical protein J3R83DRAFT_11649 [Lanmaoa asiatica]
MPKRTGKPAHYELVGSDFLADGDFEKRDRSINYAALGVQSFALVFLLVCTKDLDETISSALGIGMFGVNFVNGFF